MKIFQLFTVALIVVSLFNNKAAAQCDVDPLVDFSSVGDITLFFSSEGYCPNSSEDVDVSDSGEVLVSDITSGDSSMPDCEPSEATITFVDVWMGGCPEEIERTWTVEYNTVNSGDGEETHVQIITLEDDLAPTIDAPADPVDIMISDACDETDAGVLNDTGLAFSDSEVVVGLAMYPGSYTEDCIVSYNGNQDDITYIDVWNPDGCPSDVGVIERLWTITDECGNSATDLQIITLMDMEAPSITTCPADITVELTASCDENDDNVETITGFPYSSAQTMVTEADFEGTPGGVAEDLCDMDITVYYTDSAPMVMEDNCPNAFISFIRTWTLEDDCGNLSTDVCEQLIELFDEVDPTIDVELPDFDDTVMLNACDENDQNIFNETGFVFSDTDAMVNVADFEAQGGSVNDNCNPIWETELEITYSDVFTPVANNCPDEVGQLIRTWVVTDHCGNTTTDEQTILIFDTEAPTITVCPGGGAAIEISVVFPEPCDDSNPEIEAQSGFPFSGGPVTVDESDFNAVGLAEDNCNGGTILEAEYFDEVIGTGCETGANIGFDFIRHWTVTDLCGNTATCDQQIQLMDFEEPIFDGFPDFFYDQGPQGPGSGIWEIESIFCDAQVDFTVDYVLPGMADIVDNCSPFPNLNIGYNPDLAAGPVNLAEGDNVFMIVITDECNNRFEEEFIISMVCLGCGPDSVFETCDEPPTICDLNDIIGFNSCTPEYQGTVIESLCNGFVVNNPSYFEFIAGAEDVDLTVLPSNCLNGGGVQAAIIDPCVPTMCYTDLGGACFNTETTVSAVGLTVGNVYQLIVDGCGGDECNWQITDISATPFNIPDPTDEDPIAELPSFTGCDTEDLIFCQGSTISFWPDTFEEALYFFCWSLDNMNGVSSSNGAEDCTENTALETTGQSFSCSQDFSSCGPLELTFDEVGAYTLCLTELENGCDNQAPPDYCWEITIVENGPIDFGIHAVCQHDLDSGWFPDVVGPNGETWQGDVIFIEGMSSDVVSDDCGCMFDYQIEVVAMIEEPSVVEVVLCAYDLENFEDFELGLDWNFIEDYYDEPLGSNPYAFINPLEEASQQIAYDGVACDTFIYYDFFLYDVPGEIAQNPGPVCDVILSLEIDFSIFPDDLIDPDDLIYNWYDNNGLFSTDPSVSVTEAGTYDLIIEYFLDDGSTCSFVWDADVTNFGNPPAAPTFVQSPNETCITELAGIIYSVPPAANATYIWSVANGTFTANPGNDEISITITDPAITTTICVNASSVCGDSPLACEDIIVTPSPVVELLPVMDVCVDQAITIATTLIAGSADEYFWNIPGGNFTQTGSNMADNLAVSWPTPGTYMVEVSVEDASGCQSNLAMLEVNVLSPLAPPTASCSLTTSNTVEITLTDNPNGGAGSVYSVTTGQVATEDNGVITVTGLIPGDQVTVLFTTLGGNHPCGDQSDQISCTATDCPLNPAIETPDAICLDGTENPFQLNETAGNPGGIWMGPGTDMNGMFDPAAAGPGTHNISYEVTDVAADCTASANVSVVVYPSPVEDFVPSVDTVCIGELLSIAFDDSVGKTYTWDFDDDNSSPNADDTDFQLSYSSPGDKQITMSIATGPGCEFDLSKNIYVRPALVFPGVFCGGLSPVSVGFDWDQMAGVIDFEYSYTVNGDDEVTGTTTETEITIDGLSEGDVVDIEVIAIDVNGCSNPIALQTCIAQDCPAFDIEITATDTLVCWDPVNGIVIQLDQTTLLDGVDAVGTGEWGGSDLLDPVTGAFIPDGPDTYVLSYVFAQDGTACPGSESITINILESPASDFVQDFEEICIDSEVTFALDANYNAAYTYTWTSEFPDEAYDLIDNGDGTFTVQFFEEGEGDFSLITSVAGCESPETTVSVEVGLVPELPIINCTEDLGYILFEWTEVDCALEYIVFIDGESQGTQSNTDFELINLAPNQNVDIELEIISDCLCDFPTTVSASCTAQDCEDADLTFDASVVTSYCLSSLPVFTFTAEVNGVEIDNSGTFTWSGDGVDADGNVDFTGFMPGLYNISVDYEEDDCFYSNSITLEVLPNPEIIIETVNAPCPGAQGEVMINGDGNGPFTILAENETLTSGSNMLQAGSYEVMITDVNGCETIGSFTIGTDAEPVDNLNVPVTGVLKDSMAVLTYTTAQENIENIIWTINGELVADLDCATSDCFNLSYAPPAEGEYEVCTYAYYDGAACELIECRTFNAIEIKFNSFYIPNVITPDNDTDPINKALTIFVEGETVIVKSVGIYDRWGNRVFYNEDEMTVDGDQEAILWDGRFEQGRDFTAGVYVYLLEAEIDGFTEWVTDDITVVR